MNVFLTTTWCMVYIVFGAEGKRGKDSDVDHEDVGSIDYTNASFYTTSEMRDKVLAEWKGKTDEIQGYFDQLPSEEFKENSEDLKFKRYYETKGVKDIPTNQVWNITPHQYHDPQGPMYTIEVNDSYVPKYRVTTSEEERMEKYGTFNSESDSSEVSSEEVKKKKKKKKKKESSESGDEKTKKKKEKKAWPSNMDPKEKRKKKPKTSEEKKRKDLMEKALNGVRNIRMNVKKIQKENQPVNLKPARIIHNKLQGKSTNRHIDKTKYFFDRRNTDKIKHSRSNPKSNNQFNKINTKENKVGYKQIDNNEIENKVENYERQRKRTRHQSVYGNPIRPYL